MNSIRLLPVMALAACCVFSAQAVWPDGLFHELADEYTKKVVCEKQMDANDADKLLVKEFLQKARKLKKPEHDNARVDFKIALQYTKTRLEKGIDDYGAISRHPSDGYFQIGSLFSLIAASALAGMFIDGFNRHTAVVTTLFGFIGYKAFSRGYKAETKKIKREASEIGKHIDNVLELLSKKSWKLEPKPFELEKSFEQFEQ